MGSTIPFAVVCFLLFFALSQFFQWAKHLTLPLPIFILGGVFLAIASNFDRRAGLPFNLLKPPEEDSPKSSVQTKPTEQSTLSPASTTSPREISFTIRKSEK
jgi:hypothetical protein